MLQRYLPIKVQNKAVIGGDGQVTFGNTVLKGNATKLELFIKIKFLQDLQEVQQMLLIFDMFEGHLEKLVKVIY